MRPPARAAKLVSVVMATYNGERFIGAAIDSILAQTHSNFELIVVDDASTDATSGILAAFTDPRLRVIHSPANNGVARARNRGFDCARGDYIALLDHDDLSHPTRLARQVEYLETHPGIVLVGTLTQQLRDGRLDRVRPAGGQHT
jgi:glycosyltransferase involved in cell wall biosynthesis